MSDYLALYRKWRPRDFDEVSGQDSTTDILKYEVANGKLSHAYLFCGSRGTGKTSCAKILAKAVNCLNPKNGNPCCNCAACRAIDAGTATDVIEMDAASNNGVDNVRDLKDEIAYTPAELRYRVYIIDEVHMMSPSAFNALLKTLEEPPAYVIFILATTEFNKLPTTIVSRCQRFDFKRMSADVIISRLTQIASAEGIDLSPDGARMLARAAQGGMRDAVSLLELCAGSRKKIDAALVSATVGHGDRDIAYALIRALSEEDYGTVYRTVCDLMTVGTDLSVFWQELIEAYRDMMVVKKCGKADYYLDLTDSEYENLSAVAEKFSMSKLVYHVTLLEGAIADMARMPGAVRSVAEITLTRLCDPKLSSAPEAFALRVEELEKQVSALKFGAPLAVAAESAQPAAQKQTAAPAPKPAPAAPVPAHAEKTAVPASAAQDTPFSAFSRVVERIGEIRQPLASSFRGASAVQNGTTFTVYMNVFFANRLQANAADSEVVRRVIAEVVGKNPEEITLVVKPKPTGAAASDDIGNLLNH